MTVRCAVIGTGYWGKNLLRNLSALRSLAGLFDVDAKTQARYAEIYSDAHPFDSFEAVLASPDIDAVAIATPAASHGAQTRQALEAGKHVFVEKPLCLDVKEALSLDMLAKEKDRTLMVGHLLLYHPAFIALKAAVEDGMINRLRYIYSNRASPGKIRRVENALWSFAPHDISMILALTGQMPKTIVCNGEAWLSPGVADMTLSYFNFGDRVQAHIFVSWFHPYKDHRLVVAGESGMLVFNDTLQGKEKLLHYPHTLVWEGDIPKLDKAPAMPVAYDPTEPLRAEMSHFLNCCATGQPPRSDAIEGTNVLRILDLCQRSLNSGRPITVQSQLVK